jgi:hypothetical protein
VQTRAKSVGAAPLAQTASKPCIIAYNDNAEESNENENEGLLCSYLVAIYALLSFFFLSLPPLSSSCYHARRTRPCSQYLLLRGSHTSLPLALKAFPLGFDARSAPIRGCSLDAMLSLPKWDPHLATLLCPSYPPFQLLANSVAFPSRFPPDKEPWPPYTVCKPVHRLLRQARTP